jgi:SAM-dependent methyltransferase
VKGIRLQDCINCRHRFAEIVADEMHVSEVYSDAYFSAGGAGYSGYFTEAELLRGRGRMYARKLEKYISEKGNILDVGAAAGFILQGFIDEGWQGIGLEPNAGMANYGVKNLNLAIRQGSLENYQTRQRFDLISMIQVVAHFYDPRKGFENASSLLSGNGFLLIETWNRDSFSAKVFGRFAP